MFSNYRQLSRNAIVLSASIGAVLAFYFAWNPLLVLHMRALGASDVEIGAAFSIFIFAHTVPAVAGGMLADRIGRKWVALGPGIILTPLYFVAGTTQDWRLLSGILIVTNALGGVQWPAMQALIAESDEEHRATAFSLIEVFVLSAAVLGPLLGSLLLPFVGIGGLIIAHGLILIPMTALRIRGLHETHHAHHRQALTRANWRAAISSTAWWIIGAQALFTLALGLSLEGPFVTILAHDVWLLGDQQIQQMAALGALAEFGGVWLGSRADQWGTRRIWSLGALGFAISAFGFGFAPTFAFGIGFLLAAHVFRETLFIAAETLLAQHTARATRSFLFGLSETIAGGTDAIGPAFGSWLVSLSRLVAPFVAAAVASAISVVLVVPVSDVVVEESPASSPAE